MRHHPPRLAGILLLMLPLLTSAARGQNRNEKAPPSEDDMVARAARRVSRVSTERDRLIRSLDRAAPRTDAFGPSPNREFDDWFDRLSGGRSTWDRDTITRRPLTDIFDRMAERLNVTNGRLTRAQFHQYGRKYLAEGSSPPWDSADEQAQSAADRTFEQLDRDHDGVLSGDELSPALRAGRGKWDADRDGGVSKSEYRAYFASRIRQWQNDQNSGAGRDSADRARPMVYRAGRLPPDLPDWFARLDADGDGQVALYEWRESGWAIEEFRQLDRNDDGFLTADELAWHVARAKEHDTPERALLARHLGAVTPTPSFSRDLKEQRGVGSESAKQLKRDAKAERDSASESSKQLKRDAKADRGKDPERKDPDRKDLKNKKKGDG
jgi:EF hand